MDAEERKKRNYELKRKWYLEHRDHFNELMRNRRKRIIDNDKKLHPREPWLWKAQHSVYRIKVMEHYGQKCECCGETRFEFLSIDHINGGGNKHVKSMKGHFYFWLIKNNFPDGFRTMCYNCNLAIGFYGYCPHTNESA